MALLRLIGDILIYCAIGLLAYAYFIDDYTFLYIAIGCAIVGFIIWFYTPSRCQRSERCSDSGWDWWDLTDIIELPFTLIAWIFRGIFRIFD